MAGVLDNLRGGKFEHETYVDKHNVQYEDELKMIKQYPPNCNDKTFSNTASYMVQLAHDRYYDPIVMEGMECMIVEKSEEELKQREIKINLRN